MTTERIIQAVLLIVGSYLLGSISIAYLIGRWLGAKDLRRYGSGSLGGSTVYEHVARWAVIPVALFDIFKAAIPTWLGLELGLGAPMAVAAGMATAAGHNWSIFLCFTGGRGMGTFAGVLLIVFPWGLVWLVAPLALGWRLGDSAPWLLISLVTMPAFSYLIGGPQIVLPLAAAMLLMTLLKRLEANRRPLPSSGPKRREVLLRRLIFDRDIADHQDWLGQAPAESD